MKLLLDSHALIWAVEEPTKLGPAAVVALKDKSNELWLSAATIWELAIKCALGKLSISAPYRQWIAKAGADLGVSVLPITIEYADAQIGLPQHHRDPFDRLLIAQANVEGLSIVSADAVFDKYGVSRLW